MTICRVVTALLLSILAGAAGAQTFQFPPDYVCGNGTIRARVVSASAGSIAFRIEKTDGSCRPNLPFITNNTAYVRYDSPSGAIAGRATYRPNDPFVNVTVPGFTTGRRVYYATIDSFWAGPIAITAQSLPSLADFIGSYLVAPSRATAGQPFRITGQIMNAGAVTAGASDAQFYVASVPGGAPDTPIGPRFAVGSLAPRASSPALTMDWAFPAAVRAGTYAITLRADSTNRVTESNENNNAYTPPIQVAVSAPALPGPVVEYRIGVVAFRHAMTGTQLRQMLADIVREIGNGSTSLEGNGKRVQIVVQLEISWADTESREGQYRFEAFTDFARACAEKGVRWSVLLSPHYVPAWAADRYRFDRLVGANNTPVSYPFMPFSASSDIWRVEVPRWVRATVMALANDAGRNHFSSTVSDLLVANEVQFPGELKFISYDSATRRRRGTRPMAWSDEFREWRAAETADAIVSMVRAAKDQLRALGIRNVPVASKLVDYRFPPNDPDRSSYTTRSLATLNGEFDNLFPIDAYPKPFRGGNCGNAWTFHNDFAAANAHTTKAIYVSEFNYDFGTAEKPCTGRMSEQDVVDTIALGRQRGARYFTMFAWNSNAEGGGNHSLNAAQKAGLRRAFFDVVR